MSTTNTPDDASNTIKDPDTWTTGDEPAPRAPLSYQRPPLTQAHPDVAASKEYTKTEASKMIEELRAGNSRVQEADEPPTGSHKNTSSK